MKKIIVLIIFICFCYPMFIFSEPLKSKDQVNQEKLLTNYRSFPFQWIYPEYYYSAAIIPVKREKIFPKGFSKVDFFGLSACIPESYSPEIPKMDYVRSFKSKAGDRIIMIKTQNSSALCSEEQSVREKDFCSAYKSPQEYYHKLFTLTPETADNVGDKWLVHAKGGLFENVKKIEIYSSDKFIAYVKFFKTASIKETKFSHEITLFHINGPINSYVTITLLANDDTILNNFISTIE